MEQLFGRTLYCFVFCVLRYKREKLKQPQLKFKTIILNIACKEMKQLRNLARISGFIVIMLNEDIKDSRLTYIINCIVHSVN